MDWIRSFFVLFLLLTLLVFLTSGSNFEKYIRFFSEMILAAAFLSPVLSMIGDGDAFFEKIEYEAFAENLAELSADTAKIEFARNEYYVKKYETAIAEDVRQIAEAQGYRVESASVKLTENYIVEEISVTITDASEDLITVGKIQNDSSDRQETALKEKIAGYYQIDEERIAICRI